MLVPFESLPSTARIWIYQGDRKLNDQQMSAANEHLKKFVSRWGAHGNPLRASFDIRYQQFVILAVDEDASAPSGCSIDGSVHAIQQISASTGVDFFNRTQVAFLSHDEVLLLNLSELKEKNLAGIWNDQSLTFNNLVNTKGDLDTRWLVPAGQTWLKRYLQPVTSGVSN